MGLTTDSQMPSQVGQSTSGNFSSLTYSFTNTAGTLLLCAVSWGNHVANAWDVSSVTYGGVTMTLAIKENFDGASHNRAGAAIYYLLSPPTGANNIVVTMNSTPGDFSNLSVIGSGCISLTGHDPTTPIKAGQTFAARNETGSGTASIACTSTTSGNLIFDCVSTGSSISATAQTLSWEKNTNGNSAGGNGASSSAAGNGGTVTMSYTVADVWAIAAVEIAAAPGSLVVHPIVVSQAVKRSATY